MADTTTLSEKSGGASDGPPRNLLEWLPWEKITIWGLFLLSVYVLRHFFFIIFMTFLLTFILRGVIVRITRLVHPRGEVPWLERVLALVCFGLLIFGLYEGGSYLGPPLKSQFEALLGRVKRIEPEQELENLGTKTIGAYLFSQKYAEGRSDPQYVEDFEKFCRRPEMITAFAKFGQFIDEMESSFKAAYEGAERDAIESEVRSRLESEEAFESWFLSEEGPAQKLYQKNRKAEIDRWEDRWRSTLSVLGPDGRAEIEKKRGEPGFEERRDARIRREIFTRLQADPVRLLEYKKEWKAAIEPARTAEVARLWAERRATEEYRARYLADFRGQYEKRAAEYPPETPCPYSFERYRELEAAYEQGKEAFSEALGDEGGLTDEQLHRDFALWVQGEEYRRWFVTPTALQLRQMSKRYFDQAMSGVGVWLGDTIKYLLTLPVQLALSLLLSFFITFDIPRIRRGVRRLKTSRVADFYEEIAPGLYNFGHLIGRAFQAQGVIALFNALLTFIAIHWLGIQNEVFLCAIVFLCSFIPVLGVVLSSGPIAVMAIIQPGGTVWIALYAIGAVLVIHFLETSVLNPKILGDMLHLHPVLVLAVLAVGEHFFGVWGLLLGVPIAVFIIRFVILDEGIPGLIEPVPSAARSGRGGTGPAGAAAERSKTATRREPQKEAT